MCYLRNFAPIQKSFYSKEGVIVDSDSDFSNCNTPEEKFNVDLNFFTDQKPLNLLDNSSEILKNLLRLAQKNSQALSNLSMKIQQNDSLLDQMHEQGSACKAAKTLVENQIDTEESSLQEGTSFKTQQFLTKKLFGENREYKFKLVLDDGFPEQIFKQRNFSFNMKLVDSDGKTIRNSNIIHLCLGVCDINGEWVTQTKTKQSLMKGKTQSELYHGQACYTKIFSRDVSRHYPEGKLNIVIYPKQSVLKYFHGRNFLEQSVNSIEIEPLIIKDLTIKAKKKQC